MAADKTANETADEILRNNRVGPVFRAGEVAQAAIIAAEIDNPGKEIIVDDRVAYVRIYTDDEFLLTREAMSEALGRNFEMREVEINLASFAGRIDANSDRIRFYFADHI